MLNNSQRTAPYRVVQWTTGNVGKSSVKAVAANPNLELIGCYAWSPDKAGRDVGELVGIEPLGVTASNDADAAAVAAYLKSLPPVRRQVPPPELPSPPPTTRSAPPSMLIT